MLAASSAGMSALVLACGGDGTVHGVVQGLAHTGTALGILPLGTANVLASNLGLPPDPLAALALQLPAESKPIPLGRVSTERGARFFVTTAGCGPSGALAQALAAASRSKARLGRSAYPLYAARLFATRRWPAFQADYRLPGSTRWERFEAASVLVSRVPSLGGFLSRLTPGASLCSPSLRAWLLPPPAHLTLPAWFAGASAGLPNPSVRQIEAEEIRCVPLGRAPVLLQADAEPMGATPCSFTIVPAALNMLVPSVGMAALGCK